MKNYDDEWENHSKNDTDKSASPDWIEKTLESIPDEWRVTPRFPNGRCGLYADGQTHRNPKGYCNATAVGLILDDQILLDYDGNKANEQGDSIESIESLSKVLRVDLSCPFQWNEDKDSLHFLFRIPHGVNRESLSSSITNWRPYIDLKTGNQPVFIKPHKILNRGRIPEKCEIPECPQLIIDSLMAREKNKTRFNEQSGSLSQWNGNRGEVEEAREYLSYIPAEDYDTWIKIIMGIVSKFGKTAEASELINEWSATAFNYCGSEMVNYKIQSVREPKENGINFGTVVYKAELMGADKHRINSMFNSDGSRRTSVSTLRESYIFIDTLNQYFRIEDKQLLAPQSFNRVHLPQFPGGNGSPKADTVFQSSTKKRVVSGIGWLPVDKPIIELYGVRYANTFKASYVTPIEGDVTPWLELCQHIYGDYVDYVLDHWAFSLQKPLTKIRWQILVYGKETRTGKSLSAEPIRLIWGESGVVINPADEEAGWGDPWAGKKFIMLEEVYQPGDKGIGFFNRLKPKLSNSGPEFVNLKGGKQIVQENLYSMILYTNHNDALRFNTREDKLLVIHAPSERWQPERYEELAKNIHQGSLCNHIYDFLLKRDVSKFSYSVLPVRTDMAEQMASEAMADYQRKLIDMIETKLDPFDRPLFTFDDVREKLRISGYFRCGDKGIREILDRFGFSSYRGRSGNNRTPTFWTDSKELELLGERDRYDWYLKN